MKQYTKVATALFLVTNVAMAATNDISVDKPTTISQPSLTQAKIVPVKPTDGFIPNDPLFDKQWGLKNASRFDIDATHAWTLTRGDKKVAIVIIDTGIDYTHPDLINNMWTNPNEIPNNGKDDDNNGYIDDIHGINTITKTGDPMDDNGHGTHIAGVIGAEGNNQIGIAGVMHNVSLIACKFLDKNGSGSADGALQCMEYVADLAKRDIGVTIVATNNAWGGGGFSQAMFDAIQKHRDLNILFVAGSGSSGTDMGEDKVYPAGYDVSNVIVVAKMEPSGSLAFFSSYGPNTVHLAAPGTEILSTFLAGGYESASGSPATGFVSGTIGLLKSYNNDLTAAQIKHKILAGVTKLATLEDEEKLISGGYCDAFNSLSD